MTQNIRFKLEDTQLMLGYEWMCSDRMRHPFVYTVFLVSLHNFVDAGAGAWAHADICTHPRRVGSPFYHIGKLHIYFLGKRIGWRLCSQNCWEVMDSS